MERLSEKINRTGTLRVRVPRVLVKTAALWQKRKWWG
jgi:hypothetical protein